MSMLDDIMLAMREIDVPKPTTAREIALIMGDTGGAIGFAVENGPRHGVYFSSDANLRDFVRRSGMRTTVNQYSLDQTPFVAGVPFRVADPIVYAAVVTRALPVVQLWLDRDEGWRAAWEAHCDSQMRFAQ